MKNMKSMLRTCLTALAVVAVVGVSKTEVKAASQIQGLKQTDDSSSTVEIAWDHVNGAECVEVSYGNKTEKEDLYGSSSMSLYDLNAGSSYNLTVKLYSDDEYTNVIAEYKNFEVVTAPGRYTAFDVTQTKAGANTATLSWAKTPCPGANFYQVEYYSNGKKQATTAGNEITLKKLVKNDEFTAEVIACRKSASGYVTQYNETAKDIDGVVAPSNVKVSYVGILDNEMSMSLTGASYNAGSEYDIRRVRDGKKIKVVKKTTTYMDYKNKAFNSKDLFKVRYRCYVKGANGKKFYSGWSSYKYFSTYDVTKSLSSKGSKGLLVKWNKIKGASGYKVYASTKYNKGYKLVATVKKGSATSTYFKKYNKKALKKGQTYYVYVKPYYKDGKKIVEAENTFSYIWYQMAKYKK